MVHAVGRSQDDVFIEDGSAAESAVLLVQQQSLCRTTGRKICDCGLTVDWMSPIKEITQRWCQTKLTI